MLRALSHVHMLFSKGCRSQAICKCWFQNVGKTVQFTDVSRNTLQTEHHATLCKICRWSFQDVANTIHLQVWSSESRKNSIRLTAVNFKMLRMPCGLPVIVANTDKTMRCTKICTNMLHILRKWWVLVSKNCEHSTVYIFSSERREHHGTVCRYDPIATIMQFATLLQILPDGKARCNELMLHHAMQCTGASCKMLQIRSNFAADTTQLSLEVLTANDQHMVHWYFHAEVLS